MAYCGFVRTTRAYSCTSSHNEKKAADSKKVKYVPEDETREMRDARTIFIGNLPVGAVKSKVSIVDYSPLVLRI